MTTKSLIVAGGIVLILLAVSNFITWRVTKSIVTDDVIATLTTDSTAVDTVLTVEYDTVYIYFPYYAGALIDTVGDDIVYSTQIDTSVVDKGIEVFHLKQSVSFSNGYFDIITDIQIRPVEKLVEVTKTTFRTVLKEVPANPPFYNTYIFGSVSTIVVILLMVLLL